MKKVYTATVRVVFDSNEDSSMTTEDQIANALEKCVAIDLNTEDGENALEGGSIESVALEWDELRFEYSLKENGDMVFDDEDADDEDYTAYRE